jgi:hypothetical protein
MDTLTLIYRGEAYEIIYDSGPPPIVVDVIWFIDSGTRQRVEFDSLDEDLQEKIYSAI